MNQKEISSIVIILIIIGVLVVAGGVWYWQSQKVEPEKIEPEDETANWKIYRNEKYGFTLRYPSDWSVNENSRLGGGIPEEGEIQFAFTSSDFALGAGKVIVFSIKPTSFKNNQEFLLWRKAIDENNPNTKDIWTTKEVSFFKVGQAVEWNTQHYKTIYVVRAPYLYEFHDYYKTDQELVRIMNTFQFSQ